MNIEWEDDFSISVRCDGREVTLSANRDGLLSLAKHLTALANEEPGEHIHYDENNSLEDNSLDLIVERIE